MRKLFMILVVAAFFSACDIGADPVGYSNVSVQEAHDVLVKGDKTKPFIFLDVRTPGEFSGGHVPGAVNIPVQTLANKLGSIPKDKTVYVYCESGVRSTKAAEMLVEAGFTKLRNMKASMRGWRDAAYETER